MPMETDPTKINDADRYLESVILTEGRVYADRNERSKKENKGRAASRTKIKEAGIRTDSYALAVKHTKDLNERERADFLRDYLLVLQVMLQKQMDFFPEEVMKAQKREADRLAKEAEARTKAGPDADTNPRSDPNAGGAKPMTAEETAAELAEGDAALNAALPETKGKKKSQSQIAAEKAAAAGTDKPITVN